eukprot:TRINITY_DN3169_c0_g1_i1.p1 TRINITY_DN3169_c0_g1~~TRINITY_DN3169_c0_g1_i1.p1  ORF type:complete len:297 (-),score=68.07 TRINITY_DN3169_c0_g1_i1:95-907(-)
MKNFNNVKRTYAKRKKPKKMKIPKGLTIEKLLEREPYLSFHFKKGVHDPTNMEPIDLDFFEYEFGQISSKVDKITNIEFRNEGYNEIFKNLAEKHQIFPKLLKNFKPRMLIKVKYGDQLVTVGNEISLDTITKSEPTVDFECRGKGIWTLAMVSEDRGTKKQTIHWAKSNITDGDFNTGEVHVPYNVDFQGYGLKKVLFVLFQQSEKIEDFDFFKIGKNNATDIWDLYDLTPKAYSFCSVRTSDVTPDIFSPPSKFESLEYDFSKEFTGR